MDSSTTTHPNIQRDYRWNFVVNILDGAAFWCGMSFFSTTVILPLFINHFTTDPRVIGLVPFITWAGYLLPQLFMANVVERAPRKKFFPVVLGFLVERLPIFLLAPLTYFLAVPQPRLALALFFLLFTIHNLGSGLVGVGWQDLIAKIIPVDKRGRFFGLTNFIGNGAGILGALAVPLLLEAYPFPTGFVLTFAVTGAFLLLGWVFAALTREPAIPSQKPRRSQREFLRSLPGVLSADRNFRAYLLAQMTFALSGMATGFLIVYTIQTWHLPDAQASGFMLAMQVGLALANLFFGYFSDRKGHKLSLEICYLLTAAAFFLAFLAPMPGWFFAVFFLNGVVSAGTLISGRAIVYEFTTPDNRPTYIGLGNTLKGITGSLAPIIGGWLAAAFGYPVLFFLSAVIAAAAGLILRLAVREPRSEQPPATFAPENSPS